LAAPLVAVARPLDPAQLRRIAGPSVLATQAVAAFEWSSLDPHLARNSALFAAMPLPSHSPKAWIMPGTWRSNAKRGCSQRTGQARMER